MNRSILIVICDFLLVSLLAFSTVDINKVSDEGVERQVEVDIVTNQLDSSKDLAAVMRLAWDEERKNREALLGELAKTREAAGKQQAVLSEREKQAQTFQQEAARLQQQYAEAQTNIQALNQQLQGRTVETLLSKEKLAAMEAESRKQAEQATALKQQVAQLAKSNQAALTEKQQLAGQLQVAKAEQRAATEQAARMQAEVKVEREEKAKLAEGFKALASKSSELVQEIKENRPLAPNTIFSEFVSNRVQATFTATRPGVFGLDSNKTRDTATILATDGTNYFALCHVQDTPLTLFNPGMDWERLSGTLGRDAASVPIRSLSFFIQDPRVVWMPVTPAEARQLGGKAYRISSDPFKFQDAVLVGAKEGYYGECKFQLDLSTPEYVKLDHNFLKGLFGKFNPSRGDLVLSKTGELLGIMANNTYCMMLHNLRPAATFSFGKDLRDEHTGGTLSMLYLRVIEMPFKLQ
jgi:hypothetical protein